MIVLVYGPKACGKTRNKQEIADSLGLSTVIDGVDPGLRRTPKFRDDSGKVHTAIEDGTLLLTTMHPETCVKFAETFNTQMTIMPFAHAMEYTKL